MAEKPGSNSTTLSSEQRLQNAGIDFMIGILGLQLGNLFINKAGDTLVASRMILARSGKLIELGELMTWEQIYQAESLHMQFQGLMQRTEVFRAGTAAAFGLAAIAAVFCIYNSISSFRDTGEKVE